MQPSSANGGSRYFKSHSGKQLNDLFGKRTKLLIENAFSRNLTLVKEESDGKEGIVRLPVDSFKGLDIQPRWAK